MGDVSRCIENYFSCSLCNSLAVDPLVTEPCAHVYCKKCFANQTLQDRCKVCSTVLEDTHVCILAIEYLEGVAVVTKDLDKVVNKFKHVKDR